MDFGLFCESFVAEKYQQNSGFKVYKPKSNHVESEKYGFLGASLDMMRHSAFRAVPLEIKTVHDPRIRHEEWWTEPPLHYQIQVQAQCFLTDSEEGTLVGMFFPGCKLAWCDIQRNDDFIASALPHLEEFWNRVQRNEPPEPQGRASLDVVKRLYPGESGETVELDDDVAVLVGEWEDLKKKTSEATKAAKDLEAVIRAKMKEASFGKLPDGTLLVRKTVSRKGYTVEPSTYVQLGVKRIK
jgi:predicted phage-related endonuclease